jgi:hypothetical protein
LNQTLALSLLQIITARHLRFDFHSKANQIINLPKSRWLPTIKGIVIMSSSVNPFIRGLFQSKNVSHRGWSVRIFSFDNWSDGHEKWSEAMKSIPCMKLLDRCQKKLARPPPKIQYATETVGQFRTIDGQFLDRGLQATKGAERWNTRSLARFTRALTGSSFWLLWAWPLSSGNLTFWMTINIDA